MKLLGHEYSERVDRIYKSLSPPPKVRPFPSAWLTTGQSPQFAGMHVYHPTHGDIVFLVPEKAHEYTVAHELMHAVLRREGYPHFLSRPLRLEHNLVKLIVDSLEGAIVHPYLNQRLSNFEIAVEATYAQELLNGLKASDALEKYKAYVAWSPEYLPIYTFTITELLLSELFPQQELRAQLNSYPESWELVDAILERAPDFKTASPQQCRDFGVEVVRTTDGHLHKQFGTEEGLYFKRILFPPPPFIGDPTIPAHENFRLRLVFEEDYGWEVEVVAKDDTLCWTDGPLSQEQAKDKRLSIQARLTGLSTKEFARFCDLNLVAIDEGIDFEDN